MAFASLDLPDVRPGAAFGGIAGAESAVTLSDGAAGVAALEAVWRATAARAPDHAAFLGFGYALSAARYHEARGERVVTAVSGCPAQPCAILPVAIARRAGVGVARALGSPVTQYSDALAPIETSGQPVAAALRAIAGRADVDLFEFPRVRTDSVLAAALAEFAHATTLNEAEGPFADLGCASDVPSMLLAIAGAKQRRERARSRRRLSERGAVLFEAFRGEDAAAPLADAFRMKSGRLAQAGLFSRVIDDPDAVALFQRAARDPRDGAGIVAMRLTVDGAPAAYEVGVARGGRFHAYLGATAEVFASASPGKVLMEEALIWAKAEGFSVYDLLPPADRYKREWSTDAVCVRDVLAPVSWKGRAYAGPWLRTARPALKAALHRLPPVARRAAARAAAAIGLR